MIILDNYSKIKTYIVLDNNMFSIIDYNNINSVMQGVGGFSESKELFGVYLENDKLFLICANKIYNIDPKLILCTNDKLENNKRRFKVMKKDEILYEQTYTPYVHPFSNVVESDEDEFDFLLYLSKIIKNEQTMNNFIKGMKYLEENQGFLNEKKL